MDKIKSEEAIAALQAGTFTTPLTRDEFTRQVAVIEDYIKQQRAAGKFINATFFEGSTTSVFDFGDELVNLATAQLAKLSYIEVDMLTWLLYAGGGKCSHPATGDIEVHTSGDLWDFWAAIQK